MDAVPAMDPRFLVAAARRRRDAMARPNGLKSGALADSPIQTNARADARATDAFGTYVLAHGVLRFHGVRAQTTRGVTCSRAAQGGWGSVG